MDQIIKFSMESYSKRTYIYIYG